MRNLSILSNLFLLLVTQMPILYPTHLSNILDISENVID